MRIGVTLPQFRGAPDEALVAARVADATEAIDGIFLFDHLWAIGQPDRPALSCWPLMGAIAQLTERVVVGPLVARVSLLPDAVLAHHVESMLRIVGPDRFIAGLGAGDKLSRPENEAYGIPFPSLDERIERLVDCAQRCKAAGSTVWMGGLSPKVRAAARSEDVALNVWGVEPRRVAGEYDAGVGEVTWGGVLHTYTEDSDPTAFLRELKAAGATWAVCAPHYRPGEPPERAIKVIGDAARGA